ncbi:MAG: tyrosine-protein phosphatase, partial [Candidatus Methylomirabilales bacterium]
GEQIDYGPDSGPDFLDSWWWRFAFRRAGWMPEFQVLRSGWLRGWRRDWIYEYVQFKTIVNLASVPTKGRDRREAKWAEERGIKIFNFSWGSGGPPEDLEEPKLLAQDILGALHTDKPIWMHCVAGKDRTGALIAIMQKMRGASWGEILDTWKKYGKPNPGWVEYVWRLF